LACLGRLSAAVVGCWAAFGGGCGLLGRLWRRLGVAGRLMAAVVGCGPPLAAVVGCWAAFGGGWGSCCAS